MDEVMKAELDRLHDEDKRQNRRLDILEKSVSTQQSLAISVEKLAMNMERMLGEQEKQGERLDKLEAAPAEQWSSMKRTIFNTFVGAGAGAVATGVIYMMAQYIK
ncbi:hypothetical protein [Clostridium sp. AM58-1XD]|uniref:hypothetical protein n=1 Tax=Clostridium sp. AM58-1XD TaxID=2292307 RepID=UPI000E53281C|nr:hypothetical protein [Clostridium sp. AM58-1XD]RGY95168.1 hypothetical protein DXA13_19785 [Clostridium sp. AM58-1XD]